MAKPSSGSSRRGRRVAKIERPIPDHEIDFSDIPEMTDEQLKMAYRPGRPLSGLSLREPISIRLDPLLLATLRHEAEELGKGYQTHIHEILVRHVRAKNGPRT